MSRQVILVFFGDQRWDDDVHPHSLRDHDNSTCVPAVAAAAGGAINPLVKDRLVLEHFLEPIFHHLHGCWGLPPRLPAASLLLLVS